MNLIDKLNEIYCEPPFKDFDYNIDQTVRVLKNLEINVHAIGHLLGKKGIVVERYITGLHKENKYVVRFPEGQKETFDEEELDKRFARRNK